MKLFNHILGVVAISVLLFTLRAEPAHADLASYDLDSLVYMGGDIVNADPVPVRDTRSSEVTGVRVTRVLRGRLKVGQRIRVVALDYYLLPKRPVGHKLWASWDPQRSIGPGDHLMLFLRKLEPPMPNRFADPNSWDPDPLLMGFYERELFAGPGASGPNTYWIAPSGVRVVEHGLVPGFFQYRRPPEAYELEGPDEAKDEGLPLPDVRRFHSDLVASIRTVNGIEPLLRGKASAADLPRLLAILKQRQLQAEKRRTFLWDAIAEAAWNQIASLHSFDALADALTVVLAKHHSALSYLNFRAFSRPAGRDYLIQVVGDRAQPLDRRVACANALAYARNWYPYGTDGHYLSRMVGLCDQDQIRDEPSVLCAVLDSLKDMTPVGDNFPHASDNPEIRAAIPALQAIYATTSSEPVKFRIEALVLAAAGSQEYQRLSSPCGPVLSLIEPTGAPVAGGRLACTVCIHWEDGNPSYASFKARRLSGSIVVLNTGSERRSTLPWAKAAGGNENGWWDVTEHDIAASIRVPTGLPHGLYRIFLELSRDGKVVSVGHFMETDL